VAFLTLVATSISVAAYGAHYVLSEASRYTTLDVIRMFGGMA
jgi:hypothetical protein